MEKNKKPKKWFMLLGIDSINEYSKKILLILFVIAATLEAFVQAESFKLLESLLGFDTGLPLLLSSDYLNEVFAATCTIAVLGNAILSILFGVYDKKTLGVPFQDVLNYSMVGKEQRFTIKALTISIVFALLWYVLGCFNLLFSVLISDVVLLLFSCEDLWRFLSDKKMQRKTISEIISEVDSSRYSVYVDNWFNELRSALLPSNYNEAKEYFDLIGLVVNSVPNNAEQIQNCVGLHLQSYFDAACERVGFVEAFSLLREALKYAPDDDWLGNRIALKYLDNLKSKDHVDVANFEITALLDKIFQDSNFDDPDKKSYAYSYFCAIFENYQMTPDAKRKKLNDVLSYFCQLHDQNFGAYKANVIMNIVKYNIISNDDLRDRRILFAALVESLKQENFIASKLYIQTISEIFRAFFFTIYLEDGSLTESYRSELLALFHTVTKDRDLVPLSFMSLINEHMDDVISWLVLDSAAKGNKPRTFWDYRSLGMTWKRVVWTADEIISFAFCASHLISSSLDGRDFYNLLESSEFDDTEKIFICKTLLNQYNCNSYSDELIKKSNHLLEFCQINSPTTPYFWKQEHTYYQEKIIELESTINRIYLEKHRESNQTIWEGVQKVFGENNLFLYDPAFSLFPGSRITLRPSYEYIYANFWSNASKRVAEKLREYLILYVKETLPRLALNFKIEGVRTLLSALEENTYEYRNYQYTDDWALQKLSDSPEYCRLSHVIGKIYHDKSHQIPLKLFLKKVKIPFNFQLQYNLLNLTDEECEQYVKSHSQNGICTVGGFRLEPKYAKKYVKNNLLIENVTFFIHISLDPDGGFQIQH